MIAIHEDSDGTGYCRGCGTTIGESHHNDCDLLTDKEYLEKWWLEYRNGLTRGAVTDLWNRAQQSEREACANVCHEIQMTRFAHDIDDEYHEGRAEGAKECWQAIWMRSNVEVSRNQQRPQNDE